MDSELESMKKDLRKIKSKIMVIDIFSKLCDVGNAVCVCGSVMYGANYLTQDIKRDAIVIGCAIGGITISTIAKNLIKSKRSDLIFEKYLYEEDINNHPFKY